jgi:hypothetical protein
VQAERRNQLVRAEHVASLEISCGGNHTTARTNR